MIIETWIPVTIAAAFFQNLRSALQKHLKGRLSTLGAAYARFFFALPVAIFYFAGIYFFSGWTLPIPTPLFFIYCLTGGIFQILFTVFLLWMFSFRSFAVGTTFSKLEIVMVAALGAIILGDGLGPVAIFAVVFSAVGIILLSISQEGFSLGNFSEMFFTKPTLIGLASALFLGGSVVFFRAALLELDNSYFVIGAAYALVISLILQTIMMGLYLMLQEPGQISVVIREWRWAGAVGVAGALASIGWFTAFALEKAAYVRALGQVELLFTFFASVIIFRETIKLSEWLGIALITTAILMIVLAG